MSEESIFEESQQSLLVIWLSTIEVKRPGLLSTLSTMRVLIIKNYKAPGPLAWLLADVRWSRFIVLFTYLTTLTITYIPDRMTYEFEMAKFTAIPP